MARPLLLTLGAALVLAAGLGLGSCAVAGRPAPAFAAFVPTPLPKLDFVVPVAAPQAACLAVGDACGWLAVGHRAGEPAQLTLFRLDESGKPSGDGRALKTACPAPLRTRGRQVLGLAFHPRLPLLYVWQDLVATSKKAPPEDPAVWKDFDHLLVYALDGPAPKLLLSLARGPEFFVGAPGGSVVPDPANGRLLVPNVRLLVTRAGRQKPVSGIGWFHLAADGLPVVGEPEPGGRRSAPAESTPDRRTRLAALRAALSAGKPVGAFTASPVNGHCFPAPTSGAGIVPVSRDVLVIGGPGGVVTWDRSSRRARMCQMNLPTNLAVTHVTRLTGHPTLPVIYASTARFGGLYAIEHVDGYLTLAPQFLEMKSGTARSAPVVLTRRNLVAVGGTKVLSLVPIDAEGKFKSRDGAQVSLPGTVAEALDYSERFDRLYVALDRLPR